MFFWEFHSYLRGISWEIWEENSSLQSQGLVAGAQNALPAEFSNARRIDSPATPQERPQDS